MTIQNDILESVYQTLINYANLEKFVEKKDIFIGVPSVEQNFSKNSIVIEPALFNILQTNFISKTESARRYSFEISIFADYTQDSKDDNLKKFLEFVAMIPNAIDSSSYISSNTSIFKVELLEIGTDFASKDKILTRGAEIKYQFTGAYNSGNL
jgi:hypothetical protein